MWNGNLKVLKTAVKNQIKVARTWYARSFRSYTPDELHCFIANLGVAPGDTLLVHCSYDAFEGFAGKPTDVLLALQRAVGERGAVMMPTMPFTGTAVDYVARHPVFDVVRTPSRMGLLTELLRRSAGVVRSVHPTHPVAVWGTDAQAIIARHHEATTPCGAGSPFARLHERGGNILLLGAGIDSLTFYHWIEERLEQRMPQSPFTRERFRLASKDADGQLVYTDTRLFEPSVSRRRNLFKLVPELKRRLGWRERKIGRLTAILLSTSDVVASAGELADRGIFCYD